MTFEQFKTQVFEQLWNIVPEDFTVEFSTTNKVNDTIRDCVIIREKGYNISPVIYLDVFYEDMCKKNLTIAEVADAIVAVNMHNRLDKNAFSENMLDFDQVKERVVFRLINAQLNKKGLEQYAHQIWLDLAIVFDILVEVPERYGEIGSIRVTKRMLKLWQTDEKQIYELALKNTPRLLGIYETSIIDMLEASMRPDDFNTMMHEMGAQRYGIPGFKVVTNASRINGAATILYEGELQHISEYLGGDFYIVPSSIHEILVCSCESVNYSNDSLNKVVEEVNRTALQDGEILSDHVYFYDSMTKSVYCA